METFNLHELKVEHEFRDSVLSVAFTGSHLQGNPSESFERGQRYDDTFDRYLKHIESLLNLAKDEKVNRMEFHLEKLDDVMSRTQQSIYRMVHSVRDDVKEVIIYATQKGAARSEHYNMSKIFVGSMKDRGASLLELVEV